MSLYATCICGVPQGQEGAHRTDCPEYGMSDIERLLGLRVIVDETMAANEVRIGYPGTYTVSCDPETGAMKVDEVKPGDFYRLLV